MNPFFLPLKRQSERQCTCHALTLLYLEKDDRKKSLKFLQFIRIVAELVFNIRVVYFSVPPDHLVASMLER